MDARVEPAHDDECVATRDMTPPRLPQKYDVAILHRLSAKFHFFVFVLAVVVSFQAFARSAA